MYRFDAKVLTPGADAKALLRAFVEGGFAGVAAQEVPPPPSPLDWLVRGAQAKVAEVQRALEAQVRAAPRCRHPHVPAGPPRLSVLVSSWWRLPASPVGFGCVSGTFSCQTLAVLQPLAGRACACAGADAPAVGLPGGDSAAAGILHEPAQGEARVA